nr:PREDICTED: uncharacterized protein LOC105272400 [Fopius arisanus]
MREGPVKDIIRFDELVIQFGNRQCKKFRSQHHYKEIRNSLRVCGRLLLCLKEINSEITDFSSIYHPKYYEDVITAVNMIGRLDADGTAYEAPASAAQAGSLLKKLAALRKSNCIKLQLTDEKQNCEDFLHLLVDDYGASVSKTVEESQTLQKRRKDVKLPTIEDIKKLWEYLEVQRESAMEALKSKVSYGNWLSVARPTLTLIQLFNRRRAGEVERITLEDFEKCRGIQDFDKDLFGALDAKAQKVAKTDTRFVIRGKLNRIVPVLLTNSLLESMQLLVKLRTLVGVPTKNPYVFGLRHGADKDRWEWLSACTLMRNFSTQCGAEDPETLRGTKSRKHIATQCVLLNLNSHEVSDLANYLGHDEKIHMSHYRQPIEARDILQVSKLLEKASQGSHANGNTTDNSSDDEAGQGDSGTASCRDEEPGSAACSGSNSQKVLPRKARQKVSRPIEESVSSNDDNDIGHQTKKRKVNVVSDDDQSGATGEVSGSHRKESTDGPSNSTSKNKRKRRSTSPYGPVKRRRWVPEEVDAAMALYAKYFRTSRYPSLRQIAEDISKNPALKNRTPAQVKTWISNHK